jgi:MFS family permease
MERQRMSAVLSFLVALGIVIAGLLGPLVTGVIQLHLPENLVNQYIGGEVVTLAVAAPALLAAGVLWLKGDRLAPALAFGPAAYTVYTFVTAIVGQEYGSYDGNAERAFPLYAVLVAGGLATAVLATSELIQRPAPVPPDRLLRGTAAIFLLISVFFAFAWTSQIALVYRGDLPSEYVEGPTLFWLIKLMDLSLLLPAFTVVGIGLLKRHPVAIRLSYGTVSYAVCMSGAILGMAIAMMLKDDPAASGVMIAFLTPVTIGLACVAVSMLRLYRYGQVGRTPDVMRLPPLETRHAG